MLLPGVFGTGDTLKRFPNVFRRMRRVFLEWAVGGDLGSKESESETMSIRKVPSGLEFLTADDHSETETLT